MLFVFGLIQQAKSKLATDEKKVKMRIYICKLLIGKKILFGLSVSEPFPFDDHEFVAKFCYQHPGIS
jgi:hypothetical protein